MASISPVVLMVGYDVGQLSSQSNILKLRGLYTIEAHTFCEAVDYLEILASARCDLVVICTSVSVVDQRHLIGYIVGGYPWIKFTVLSYDDDLSTRFFLDKVQESLGNGPFCCRDFSDLNVR